MFVVLLAVLFVVLFVVLVVLLARELLLLDVSVSVCVSVELLLRAGSLAVAPLSTGLHPAFPCRITSQESKPRAQLMRGCGIGDSQRKDAVDEGLW